MKFFIYALFFIAGIGPVAAQTGTASRFDHVGIQVRNLDSSTAFYMDLFGIDSIPNPFPGFRVKWLDLGGSQQLHLIEGLKQPLDLPLMSHVSLRVKSIDHFIEKLRVRGVTFYNGRSEPGKINLRGDGVKQVLFRDPDGYWIEANDRQ